MKTFLRLLLLALVAAPFALAWAMIEPAPLASRPVKATPEGAKAVHRLFTRVREVTIEPVEDPTVRVSTADLEAVIAFGARVIPGLRGEAEVTPAGVRARISAPVPLFPQLGWINAEATVPPFSDGPRLETVRVGRLDLPPGLALEAARIGANLVLGGESGDRALAAAPELAIEDGDAVVTVRMDDAGRKSLFRRLAGTLRGEDMPAPEAIDADYMALRGAAERGALPADGSLLPYLRFAVARAIDQAEPGHERRAFATAIFALNAYCGSQPFSVLITKMTGGEEAVGLDEGGNEGDDREWNRGCRKVTLGGRQDSRRHFITSAAIETASTMRISFAMGEFKELKDSIDRWGFEFADIAANVSGLQFVETFMRTPPARWPELLARMDDEESLVVDFGWLPGKLKRAEFEARYGDADSPEYAAMMNRIEARVAALPLHAPLPGS